MRNRYTKPHTYYMHQLHMHTNGPLVIMYSLVCRDTLQAIQTEHPPTNEFYCSCVNNNTLTCKCWRSFSWIWDDKLKTCNITVSTKLWLKVCSNGSMNLVRTRRRGMKGEREKEWGGEGERERNMNCMVQELCTVQVLYVHIVNMRPALECTMLQLHVICMNKKCTHMYTHTRM